MKLKILFSGFIFFLCSFSAHSFDIEIADSLASFQILHRIEKFGGSKISGNNQNYVVGKTLKQPFITRVIDTLGNPIPDIRVYFEVVQTPEKSEGARIVPRYIKTDSLGIAQCFLTLGDTEGEYQVSAKIRTDHMESFVLFNAHAKKENWVTMLVVGLLGGLALFLMGINMMSSGFKHSAGQRIRSILGKLSKNRVTATGFGAFITMVTQSSSATTVMLVGFVQSGLLKFPQTIGMIFGAAIGTTLTVQLISFNLADYSLLIVALGFMLMTFTKRENVKFAGEAILGFGILFFGMHLMSQAMYPLRTFDPFIDVLSNLKIPILGIVAGTIFTAMIQSSAAFVGIMLTLASQGLLSLEASIPLILGANLGTSITGIIAGLNASRDAKKVAMAYTVFKLLGILMLVWIISPFVDLVRLVTPDLFSSSSESIPVNIPRQIANAHTIFNVLITLVMLPFTGIFAKLIDWVVPKTKERKPQYKVEFLDKNLLSTPAVALKVAKQEVVRLYGIVQEMVDDMLVPFISKDRSPLKRIGQMEEKVDFLRDQINSYLLNLTRQDVTEQSIQEAFQIMYAVKELEQIADIVSKNISEKATWWLDSEAEFSSDGKMELKEYHLLTQKQLKRSKQVFEELNLEKARKMLKKYQDFKEVGRELERQHFERLKKDINKSVDSSKTHLELVSMFRTIGSHANNIAQVILEWPGNKEKEK
ncbi:MAG TPA: Na/Pi symporter [Tenuifilaceae bacterium]|nr:Na/Pi symporter [Tenuifilaceae bacterium]